MRGYLVVAVAAALLAGCYYVTPAQQMGLAADIDRPWPCQVGPACEAQWSRAIAQANREYAVQVPDAMRSPYPYDGGSRARRW
jgi:hypothetical protein